MKKGILRAVLAVSLMILLVLAGYLLLSDPVSISVVGTSGRRYANSVAIDMRLTNRRPWSIYYYGLGDNGTTVSFRVLSRKDSLWQELEPKQYVYVAPVVRERIRPLSSTTVCIHGGIASSAEVSRIGIDFFSRGDCELLGVRWGRWFTHPRTVWSDVLALDYGQDVAVAVPIMVEQDGTFGIAGARLTVDELKRIMERTNATYGRSSKVDIIARNASCREAAMKIDAICASLGFTNIEVSVASGYNYASKSDK